jgi:hypothetical protein
MARDVTSPRLNQRRRLGNFKLKGGAAPAVLLGGGFAAFSWDTAWRDGRGSCSGRVRAGPAAQ